MTMVGGVVGGKKWLCDGGDQWWWWLVLIVVQLLYLCSFVCLYVRKGTVSRSLRPLHCDTTSSHPACLVLFRERKKRRKSNIVILANNYTYKTLPLC